MDKVCNALSSRLREWYGLHFPELDNIIDGIAGYSKIVTTGRREDLNEDAFTNAGFPESKVNMLNVVQEKSRGGEISDENLEIVKSLAQRMLDMLDLRKNLEDHLEKEMNNVAPNLAIILGTGVAARMLSRTGSLKKLSSLPASTIQVLGAERALFRSLKTGAPPPKHGILFQHTLVHAAPRWQRGKIARAVAAKAVIAARVDVYGNGVNATLMEKLNLRIKEIDTKYSDAPEPRPDAANNERDHNSKAWDKNKDDFKSNRDSKPRGGFRDKDRGSSRDGDRGSFDKFKKRDAMIVARADTAEMMIKVVLINSKNAVVIVARVDTVEMMTEVDSEETMTEADTAEMMIEVVLINSKNAAMIVALADTVEMVIEVDLDEIMTEADIVETMTKAALINSKNAAMIVARADTAEIMTEADSER